MLPLAASRAQWVLGLQGKYFSAERPRPNPEARVSFRETGARCLPYAFAEIVISNSGLRSLRAHLPVFTLVQILVTTRWTFCA